MTATRGMSRELDHFREAMRRMPVSRVWRGHGSAIFIEFGKLTPTTRLDGSSGESNGEFNLMIQWSWRIEEGSSIVCGSWSEESLWQMTFDRMVGRTLVDLETFGNLPEIQLSLSGDLRVLSFMTSEGDPEWALFDRTCDELLTIHSRNGVVKREE